MWSICIGTAVIAAVLLYAAYRDAVCREVPDWLWAVGGAAGLLTSQAAPWVQGSFPSASGLLASLSILACIFSDRVPAWVLLGISVLCSAPWIQPSGWASVVPSATAAAVLAMYRTGMVRGGADAKALIVIAVAYPVYPEIPGLPLLWDPVPGMSLVLNPAVAVLTLALLISLAPMPLIAVRNILDGRLGRGMFSSYPMGLEEARRSFVWPVQDVSGGETVWNGVPEDPEEVYGRLEEAGAGEVLVTPMVPFVVPIAAAFILVIMLGNPVFALAA